MDAVAVRAEGVCVSCDGPAGVFEGNGRTRKQCNACRHANRPTPNSKRWGGRCAHCGKAFTAYRPQTYCSRRCAREVRQRPPCECKQCGREFVPKAVDRTTYCSRDCAFDAKSEGHNEREARVAAERALWKAGVCEVCGKPFERSMRQSRLCSRECWLQSGRDRYHATYEPTPERMAACRQCGESITWRGRGKRKYCGACRAMHDAAGNSVCAHRRRARLGGAQSESIDPVVLFEIDDWVCQLCGGLVQQYPKSDRSWHDDRANIDHPRRPITRHTYPLSPYRNGIHAWPPVLP